MPAKAPARRTDFSAFRRIAVCLIGALLVASTGVPAQSNGESSEAATGVVSARSDADSPESASGAADADAGAAALEAGDAGPARTDLNLLGQVNTSSGEARRNENVRITLIDNNVLKELSIRMGITVTLVEEFSAGRNYFGAEFGANASTPVHIAPAPVSGVHGRLHFGHNNSVFSARSFFQVGSVKPAHDNDYGFTVAVPVWSKAGLTIEGGRQNVRGSVNGNVLVPRADERTPLATDPATRGMVARILAAYPEEPPNRTDIDPRALNTNAPQSIDNDTSARRSIRPPARTIISFCSTASRRKTSRASNSSEGKTPTRTRRITAAASPGIAPGRR